VKKRNVIVNLDRWHRFKAAAIRNGFLLKGASDTIEWFSTPRMEGQRLRILFLDRFTDSITLHEASPPGKDQTLVQTQTFRTLEQFENWLKQHPLNRRVA